MKTSARPDRLKKKKSEFKSGLCARGKRLGCIISMIVCLSLGCQSCDKNASLRALQRPLFLPLCTYLSAGSVTHTYVQPHTSLYKLLDRRNAQCQHTQGYTVRRVCIGETRRLKPGLVNFRFHRGDPRGTNCQRGPSLGKWIARYWKVAFKQ